MSSRKEKKKACSAPRKSRKRPYDSRPSSARNSAKRRPPSKAIRVILPAEPPPLNPEAARVLLRILLKAHDRLTDNDHPDGGTE